MKRKDDDYDGGAWFGNLETGMLNDLRKEAGDVPEWNTWKNKDLHKGREGP